MELLERYLTQIERHLPLKDRSETTKELRSLILDQLDEAISTGLDKEIALYNIIVEMGDPRDVANNYFDSKPLISRKLEPTLKLVLKIMSITLPLGLTFGHMLDYVLNNDNTTVMDNLLNIVYTVPSTLYSLLFGYGIVFVIFFLIERYIHPNADQEFNDALIKEKEFNPNLLPKIPTKHFKVSLFESIFSILVTTLIVYLFNIQEGLIAITVGGTIEHLFNTDFDRLLPFINISWFISIGLNIYYLFKRRKTITSKTIELFHHIYSGVIFILLANSSLFNTIIIDGFDLDVLPALFKIVFNPLGIIIIVGSVIQYIKMFINIDALEDSNSDKKS